jgi:hypothetical protein
MRTVSFQTNPILKISKPQLLFTGKFESSTPVSQDYDISLDGQRFLMVQNIEAEQTITRIHIIHNWIEELKAKFE